MFNRNWWCLDSNRGALVSELITLSAMPQPLTIKCTMITCQALSCQHVSLPTVYFELEVSSISLFWALSLGLSLGLTTVRLLPIARDICRINWRTNCLPIFSYAWLSSVHILSHLTKVGRQNWVYANEPEMQLGSTVMSMGSHHELSAVHRSLFCTLPARSVSVHMSHLLRNRYCITYIRYHSFHIGERSSGLYAFGRSVLRSL